jgi:hypothetical protein
MKEDSKVIEAEVMAELKLALNFDRGQPPTSISIPTVIKEHDESVAQTASMDTGSLDDEERALLTKVEDAVAARRSTQGSCGSSEHGRNDFLNRLSNLSMDSGSVPDSNPSSQRFYIGTVNEEEACSVQSKVSRLEADDLSHNQLLRVVQRLYSHLKKSDEALSRERKRRNSRESSLIKLAKEMSKRKTTINRQMKMLGEVSQLEFILLLVAPFFPLHLLLPIVRCGKNFAWLLPKTRFSSSGLSLIDKEALNKKVRLDNIWKWINFTKELAQNTRSASAR